MDRALVCRNCIALKLMFRFNVGRIIAVLLVRIDTASNQVVVGDTVPVFIERRHLMSYMTCSRSFLFLIPGRVDYPGDLARPRGHTAPKRHALGPVRKS